MRFFSKSILAVFVLSILFSITVQARKSRSSSKSSKSFTGSKIKLVEEQRKCPMQRDYYLYKPAKIDENKVYRLVIGIHGFQGNRYNPTAGKSAAGLSRMAASGSFGPNVIVVGPSLHTGGMQYLQHDTGKQLVGIIDDLRKEFNLYDKSFIYGFSAGGQYSHRFAMKHSQYIAGVSAHAAGTWATGSLQNIGVREKALMGHTDNHLLVGICCGLEDKGKSFGPAPFGRLEWTQKMGKLLYDKNISYKEFYVPGAGHQVKPENVNFTLECYWLSTCGMTQKDFLKTEKLASGIMKRIRRSKGKYSDKTFEALNRLKKKKTVFPACNMKSNAPARGESRKVNSLGWYTDEKLAEKRRNMFFEATISKMKAMADKMAAAK